jgi:hypothetical protein
VLFVVNLTHDRSYVQFSSVLSIGIFVSRRTGKSALAQINLSKHKDLRRKLIVSVP